LKAIIYPWKEMELDAKEIFKKKHAALNAGRGSTGMIKMF